MNEDDSNVSIGELVRVVGRLEQTISAQSQLYVLSSLYGAEQAAMNRRVEELAKELAGDRADRKAMFRLVLSSYVLPALLLIYQVLVIATRGAST